MVLGVKTLVSHKSSLLQTNSGRLHGAEHTSATSSSLNTPFRSPTARNPYLTPPTPPTSSLASLRKANGKSVVASGVQLSILAKDFT